MTESRPFPRTPAEFEASFRESRIQTLISVNLQTFWSISIIIIAFGLWDYYADPANWRRAFTARVIGAVLVTASGVYQNLPGRARSLIVMSKVRLVIAAMTSIIAASLLSRGYGLSWRGSVPITSSPRNPSSSRSRWRGGPSGSPGTGAIEPRGMKAAMRSSSASTSASIRISSR